MDYLARVDELLAEASSLPHGTTRAALCEEAVRLADAHDDIDAGYKARQEHIHAAMFAGQPQQTLVAFSWCQAQVDRFPDRFDVRRFLWHFKWMFSCLEEFPQVSQSEIERLFEEMQRRYRAYGASLQVVWKKRWGFAVSAGDLASAERAHAAMVQLQRDSLSDCLACEKDSEIDYHLLRGDDERTCEIARPLLEGRLRCGVVPHITYATVLIPLLRLGRQSEAARYQLRGYRMICRNTTGFASSLAYHIKFLALVGELSRGLRYFEKHLGPVLEGNCPGHQFALYRGAKLLFERLEESGRQKLKLRLPDAFPLKSKSNEYRPGELRQWFTDQVMNLARQFDARNGNGYHTQLANESQDLMKLALPISTR